MTFKIRLLNDEFPVKKLITMNCQFNQILTLADFTALEIVLTHAPLSLIIRIMSVYSADGEF